jgi:hypothetical protein
METLCISTPAKTARLRGRPGSMKRVLDTFAVPGTIQNVFIRSREIGIMATCFTYGIARLESRNSSRGTMNTVPG